MGSIYPTILGLTVSLALSGAAIAQPTLRNPLAEGSNAPRATNDRVGLTRGSALVGRSEGILGNTKLQQPGPARTLTANAIALPRQLVTNEAAAKPGNSFALVGSDTLPVGRRMQTLSQPKPDGNQLQSIRAVPQVP